MMMMSLFSICINHCVLSMNGIGVTPINRDVGFINSPSDSCLFMERRYSVIQMHIQCVILK